jgi:uncharacterized protein YndB with AHSA1/START domain
MSANRNAPFAIAEMLIRKPVSEVFNAFVDPIVTTRFWFTKSSGSLEAGNQVNWTWEMYGISMPVSVISIEKNSRILLEWGEGDEKTAVEWTFKSPDDDSTFVSIVNGNFKGDVEKIIHQLRNATEGFTLVLAGAKAWLEHGVELNLVGDRFPQGLE